MGGTFGDSHKVNLGRNDRKEIVLNWARWIPVCGCLSVVLYFSCSSLRLGGCPPRLPTD